MRENDAILFEVENTPPDRFVELFSNHYGGIALKPHSSQGKMATAGILGGISDLRYDVSTSSGGFDVISSERQDYLMFTFPEIGGMRLETSRGRWETGANEAVASAGATIRRYGFPGERKHTNLAFDSETLRMRLSILFETPVREPLEFETVVAFDANCFAPLAWLLQGLKNPELGSLDNMAAATSFSHFVQDMLLEIWPHNHSHLFERRVASPARPQVQAAINYIHDYAHQAPSTMTVAQASGMSLRTLQHAFREATGKTILEYMRDIRLQKAKEDLLKHRDEPLVDIARRWGFSNVGRFSRQFFEAFGELPSQMRRR